MVKKKEKLLQIHTRLEEEGMQGTMQGIMLRQSHALSRSLPPRLSIPGYAACRSVAFFCWQHHRAHAAIEGHQVHVWCAHGGHAGRLQATSEIGTAANIQQRCPVL